MLLAAVERFVNMLKCCVFLAMYIAIVQLLSEGL